MARCRQSIERWASINGYELRSAALRWIFLGPWEWRGNRTRRVFDIAFPTARGNEPEWSGRVVVALYKVALPDRTDDASAMSSRLRGPVRENAPIVRGTQKSPIGGSTRRSAGAPTSSGSSPTGQRSYDWSVPSSPNSTTSGLSPVVTWASSPWPRPDCG